MTEDVNLACQSTTAATASKPLWSTSVRAES